MNTPYSPVGNAKRAIWRSKCRAMLAEHIFDTLNLRIKPSEVRLRPILNETPYEWEIIDASLTPIFEKHLSKHSVGVYVQLCNGLGQKFRAVHSGQESSEMGSVSSVQQQFEDITAELEEAQSKIQLYEQERHAVQAEQILNVSMLEDAQTTIALQQQDIQNWMYQANLYYKRYTQCQDALGQIQCSLQLMNFQDDVE